MKEQDQPQRPEPNDLSLTISGLVVLGGVVTGIAGLVLTGVGAANGDYTGAGISLLAAAIVFGALSNALFRT